METTLRHRPTAAQGHSPVKATTKHNGFYKLNEEKETRLVSM